MARRAARATSADRRLDPLARRRPRNLRSPAAAFAFIADPVHAPAFDDFSLGTPQYPDRSATLVLQVEGFGTGQRLLLSGPGIADVQSFSAQRLPPDFQARIAANRALFPRGVDVILVSPNAVAALPRSVASARG